MKKKTKKKVQKKRISLKRKTKKRNLKIKKSAPITKVGRHAGIKSVGRRLFKRSKRKQDGKDFAELSTWEKKNFLSMDLVERMIRIEQRVSASFGKKVTYNQTDYYKSLSDKEKKAFESYLGKNKRKKFLLGLMFIAPLLVLGFLRMQVTGNIIRGAIEDNTVLDVSLLEPVLAFVVLGAMVLFLLTLAFKKRRNTKFEKNFEILENVFLQKGMIKHFY